MKIIEDYKTAILAQGSFPCHELPLAALRNAQRIICCDGATEQLVQAGFEPDFIVGDLDSISDELRKRYASILFHNPDQETNDQTKSVQFCIQKGWNEITILGATGNREDHTLANISLLADYAKDVKIQMLTDNGVFTPIVESTRFDSFAGQQVSIFSITPDTMITSKGLVYPLDERKLTSWWQGSLNESEGEVFEIQITKGKVLIFREY